MATITPVPYRADARTTLVALILAAAIIVLLVALYSLTSKEGLTVFAGGGLISVGSAAICVLLGLLFGVPHSGGKPTADGTKLRLVTNTNPDQISDLLIKILVRVGLT